MFMAEYNSIGHQLELTSYNVTWNKAVHILRLHKIKICIFAEYAKKP